MAVIQIRIEEELKNQAMELFENIGIDLSTAIRMFLKRSVVLGEIPYYSANLSEEVIKGLLAIERMRYQSQKLGNNALSDEDINEEIKRSRESQK